MLTVTSNDLLLLQVGPLPSKKNVLFASIRGPLKMMFLISA